MTRQRATSLDAQPTSPRSAQLIFLSRTEPCGADPSVAWDAVVRRAWVPVETIPHFDAGQRDLGTLNAAGITCRVLNGIAAIPIAQVDRATTAIAKRRSLSRLTDRTRATKKPAAPANS